MPELPEVETIRIGLSQYLPGKKITGVWHDWPKGFPNAAEDVEQFLKGATITDVKRRAKVLMIELSSQYTLVIHLKMTGQLVYSAAHERFGAGHPNESLIGNLPDKSTRVIFDLEWEGDLSDSQRDAAQGSSEEQSKAYTEVRRTSTGAADTAMRSQPASVSGSAGQQGMAVRRARLFFNDQRKFGWVRLMPTLEVPNIDFFRKVGPEPLSADFTQKEFRQRLSRRANTNIKAALLDQSVIAGIGNIYADESLWAASIHPVTVIKNVSTYKLNKLYEEIRKVLQLSIEKGGSTDKNYVNAEGKKGGYLDFANVFRREGLPCPRCGTVIIKIRVAGRGTHVCPKCQKVGRK